jgi:phosphoglycolate phosphatase-like HAD superfamily hydrolase
VVKSSLAMSEVISILDGDDNVWVGSYPMYFYCLEKAIMSVPKRDRQALGIHMARPYEELQYLTRDKWGARHEVHLKTILQYDDLVEKASKVYMDHLESVFRQSIFLQTGTIEALEQLPIRALATGVHPRVLAEKLDDWGLDPDFFDSVVTAYDDDMKPEYVKPQPHMVYKTWYQLEQKFGRPMERERTIVVGDSLNDIAMARRAKAAVAVGTLTGRMTKVDIVNQTGLPKEQVDRLVDQLVDGTIDYVDVEAARAEGGATEDQKEPAIDYVMQDIRRLPAVIGALCLTRA